MALGRDTFEDASDDMFHNLEKGSKAEMVLDLLYLSEPDQLVLFPVNIDMFKARQRRRVRVEAVILPVLLTN